MWQAKAGITPITANSLSTCLLVLLCLAEIFIVAGSWCQDLCRCQTVTPTSSCCAAQVVKPILQTDFEAGTVQLSATASGVSGSANTNLASVLSSASAAAELVQTRAMAVAIALLQGEPNAVNTAGECCTAKLHTQTQPKASPSLEFDGSWGRSPKLASKQTTQERRHAA